jgi:hypothetical protein
MGARVGRWAGPVLTHRNPARYVAKGYKRVRSWGLVRRRRSAERLRLVGFIGGGSSDEDAMGESSAPIA